MNQIYSMVLTSITALTFFGVVAFTWCFVFSRKKISLFYPLIFLSIIPLLNLWRPGLYQSGDMGTHVMILISFYHSLQQGIFLPRWSAEFCAGFGYPHIQFFYLLPYYLGSFFHWIGLNFIDSIKLLFTLSFLGAAVSMFIWLREEFGERAAFVGAVLYVFAPYQLIDLHFTSALGESLAFALVPILFLCSKKVVLQKDKMKWLLVFVCAFSALILTHHIVPLICLPFLVLYVALTWKLQKKPEKKSIFVFLGGLVIAFLLTIFHWLPILLESKWVQQSQIHTILFYHWWEFFYSPWRWGFLFEGHYGEVSPVFGYAQLAIFVIGIALSFPAKIKKHDRVLLRFFLLSDVVLFVMMQSFMAPIWLATPILNTFQTTRRLLFMTTILNAGLAAVVVKNFQFKRLGSLHSPHLPTYFMVVICIIACLSTILNWNPRALVTNRNDQTLIAEIPSRCDQVALPIWTTPTQVSTVRAGDLQVLAGNAEFVELPRSFTHHQYVVRVTSVATLKENTTYFPDWVATLNGAPWPIDFHNPSAPGIIVLHLQPGLYLLSLEYQPNSLETLTAEISLLMLVALLAAVAIHLWKKK